jgi:hypothetical protein
MVRKMRVAATVAGIIFGLNSGAFFDWMNGASHVPYQGTKTRVMENCNSRFEPAKSPERLDLQLLSKSRLCIGGWDE